MKLRSILYRVVYSGTKYAVVLACIRIVCVSEPKAEYSGRVQLFANTNAIRE